MRQVASRPKRRTGLVHESNVFLHTFSFAGGHHLDVFGHHRAACAGVQAEMC